MYRDLLQSVFVFKYRLKKFKYYYCLDVKPFNKLGKQYTRNIFKLFPLSVVHKLHVKEIISKK